MFRTRVFYGWWIVLASVLIAMITGTFFYGITFFVDPMAEEFGWSHATIMWAVSIRTVELGIAAPIVGFVVNRWGPRRLLVGGGLMGGVGFILLSQVNSLPMFYAVFVIVALGFSACGSVVLTTVVANWFHRRVGLAMGLTLAGFGLGGLLMPMVGWLVDAHGWQSTMIVLGIGTCLTVPSLGLMIRRRPEDCGCMPDGDAPVSVVQGEGENTDHEGAEFSTRRALRTQAFWFLSIAAALGFMGMNAVTALVASYLDDEEVSTGMIWITTTFLPLSSVVGRLGFGWMGDIFTKKRVLAGTVVLQIIGLVAFCYAPNAGSLALFLVTFGLGYGGAIALRPGIQRDYFGRSAFGAIQGMVMGIVTIGGMIGPVVAGWVFDTRGDYQLAWIAFAIANVAAIPLVLAMKRPQVRV